MNDSYYYYNTYHIILALFGYIFIFLPPAQKLPRVEIAPDIFYYL